MSGNKEKIDAVAPEEGEAEEMPEGERPRKEALENARFVVADEGLAGIEDNKYFSFPRHFWIKGKEKLEAKETEQTRGEIELKLDDFLRTMNEEIMQLSEFVIEEKKSTRELCVVLRRILKHLDVGFTIPPKNIPFFKKARQIILNSHGHLLIIYEDGRVDSNVLEDCSPETVLTVVWNVIPKLRRIIKLYREKIGLRVNFFEKIRRELENASKAFETTEEKSVEPLEETYQEDIIRKTSASKSEG